MSAELWWHAFTMECDCGVTTTLMGCESTEHPEEVCARMQGKIPLIACQFGCEKYGLLRYVRSWNHEPSAAEREFAGLEPGL